MARPVKATVDYFPHSCIGGKTMFTLETSFGNDGYACWFKVLELLGSTENHFIDCRNEETWEFLLAKTRLESDKCMQIIDKLSKLNAIDQEFWKAKIIYSMNFIAGINDAYKRRCIQLPSREELLHTLINSNGVSAYINPQTILEETKQEEIKEESGFKKPTLELVTNYCMERGNSVNPNRFIDFYESKGWFIGKTKMKDWKAAVRTWEQKDKENTGTRDTTGLKV